MHAIPISKFKATCLAVLERVRTTRTPILVTRFGKPIAQIVPPTAEASDSWLGCMEDSVEYVGELIEPAVSGTDWDDEPA